MVLAELAKIYVKEQYLCKGHLANLNVEVVICCVEQLYVNFCESDICKVYEAILRFEFELRKKLF